MAYIYRIEDEHAFGPYRSGILDDWDVDDNKHPTPVRDQALGYFDLSRLERRHWRFGFDSLDQLKAWFDNEEMLADLTNQGFAISKYRVHARLKRVSDKQAIFRMPDAKKVERIEISALATI